MELPVIKGILSVIRRYYGEIFTEGKFLMISAKVKSRVEVKLVNK